MADDTSVNLPTVAEYWPGNQTSDDPAYKRSKKTKKELVATYDRRVKMSRRWREESYDKTWKRLIDLYKGKHFTGLSSQDRIAVNVSFSTVNVIMPSVAVNAPHISANASHPDLDDAASKIEAGVNYWWRKHCWQTEVKRCVKDSLVVGHGWAKVGWYYSEKSRDLSPEEKQQQYGQMRQQADQAAMAQPAIAADLPSDEDIYNSLPDTDVEVVEDHPFVERVSPFDMLVDPEATCVYDLKWICQRIVAPIERVRNDDRYNAAARKDLKPDMAANPRWRDDDSADSGKNDQKKNDDIQRVTLFEFWDIEHDYYCVFSAGSERFLVEPTQAPYPFGHPFVMLPNYEVPDQFYAIGDLEALEPMQQELNAVRSDMMNHRKRWQRAYMALRDKLDSDAQASLMSDKDGRIVWIDGDEDLARIVQPIAQVPLDPQMYQYSNQIEADIELVSGVSEYQRGAPSEIRRTATEANMIQDATNARVSDKLAQVELFMSEIARRIVQLAQMYLTGEQVARIVGPDGAQNWVKFTREEIAGEFDFTVEAGSTQPKNDVFRRQQALQLAQTLQPYIGVAVNPQALASYILKEGFGVTDPSPFIVQQQPEHQPQQKIIESLSYKDLPPDIQRQVEQQAGFQPSQVGGVSSVEQQQAQADQQSMQAQQDAQHGHDQAAQDAQQQLLLQAMQQQAQAQQQGGPPNGGQ